MGNQQPSGRIRNDTYSQYDRDDDDSRCVTLDNDSAINSNASSFDERVRPIDTESKNTRTSLLFFSHNM